MPLLHETRGILTMLIISFWHLAVSIVCLQVNAVSGWSHEAAESKDICHFYAFVILDKTPSVVHLTEENTAHLTVESLGPDFQHQIFLPDNTFPRSKQTRHVVVTFKFVFTLLCRQWKGKEKDTFTPMKQSISFLEIWILLKTTIADQRYR